ncbi:MAG: response regulator [Pyrinomonadaceae bacterium]
MRLELEQDRSTIPFTENTSVETSTDSQAAEAVMYLREGIKAAQAGNRAAARIALSRAAELDPRSESAWLWLSSISEYPEELFVFLTNVLEINPENARALEWAAATKSLLAKSFVQRGIDAAEANQPDAATQYFSQALEYDKENTMAWLWLASLSDSNEGKLTYLEKVLEFDPENEAAGAAYKAARDSIRANLLTEAQTAAVAGNTAEAHELLDAILAEEPNAEGAWVLRSHLANAFDEKIEAFKRILEINPDNVSAKASLESLTSIMDAVAPKAAEGVVEEGVARVEPFASSSTEEVESRTDFDSAARSDLTEEVPEPVVEESDVPAWMASTAEEELAVDEEVAYDGTIQVNYADESPVAEEAFYSPAGFVDADSESQFESTGEASSFNFVPAETDAHEEPLHEETEEITYELAPQLETEPVADFEVPAEQEFSKVVAEEADLSVPVPSPFGNGEISNTEEYPTLISINIDPELLANAQEEKTNRTASVSPESGENADTEMPFGMTMMGGRVPAPAAEDEGFSMPFGMTMTGGRVPAPEASERFNVPLDMTMFGSNIPMPDAAVEPPVEKPIGPETHIVSRSDTPRVIQPTAPCSFCSSENDVQAISCQGCMAVLTLADLEMLLSNHHADKLMLRQAVERMESERSSRAFDENELMMLGIGHLNLRNLQYGYNYLHEASQLNPSNVVLASQVNALLIRLDEIKQQEEVHESMTKGKTILVVDDSPTVRKLIAGKLEKCGYDVFCSNDGVEAMERLEELRPDLILLDINMPRMDGYQVCKLIRSNNNTKDVPVVMISGKDGFFDKVRGRMAGTSGYITKPFGPETLMKAVEEYLNHDAV